VSGRILIEGPEVDQVARSYGLKAAGLARLRRGWTPPYFCLSAGSHGAKGLSRKAREAIVSGLQSIAPSEDGVLVRSSALTERLERRGALDSVRCSNSAAAVRSALETICADLSPAAQEQLAFVVQRWVPNAAAGHLSNERRVSRDSRSWLCEAELPVAARDRSFRFRVDRGAGDASSPACKSIDELSRILRGIARRAAIGGLRLHLEWVWDGTRVWIVQCDQDMTAPGKPPGSAWKRAPISVIGRGLRIFKTAPRSASPFPKVNHVRLFRKLGLPHGDIRVLSGADVVAELANGHVRPDLRADLEVLIAEPIVVRTDVKAETVRPEVLSRRTDTCVTMVQLEHFLTRAATEFLKGNNDPSEVAFLAHRFMLGRAGAFSFAQPTTPRVLIDATWGIPDSLLFHPHDSYRVDTEQRTVEKYLRCKTDYIDVEGDGRWKARSAGRPWDWRRSLSDHEVLTIGDMTTQIADAVGEPVEVMFFINTTGEHPILPWFYRVQDRQVADLEAAPGYYIGEKVVINERKDLAAVERRLAADPEPRRLTLTLRPNIDLLRSRPFITAVAELAKRRSLPVELEGSQLSHAYYLLEDADVGVRCVNPWRSPEGRQTFGKLVRELVPIRIERHGELARIYHARRGELLDLVKAKAVEEALELYWEKEGSAVVEEIADLLELLRTAAEVQEVDFHEVELAAERKRKERGGFTAGVVLVETRRAPSGARITATPSLLPDPPARRRPATTRRRVFRLPGRRLILPLIPPTGWTRDSTHAVALDSEEEIAISYGKDVVTIQVGRRVSGPGSTQLQIPGLAE
jgi:predicted house-cleaning noncanonical NTP pyrophosphatase (MazG superfamily)